MISKKAIRILKNHVNWFLSRTGKYIYVAPEDVQDLSDALQIATDAIKKTIPVQPILYQPGLGTVTKCPTCKHNVFDSDFKDSTNKKMHIGFCIFCGQRFTKPSDILGRWEDIKNCNGKRN